MTIWSVYFKFKLLCYLRILFLLCHPMVLISMQQDRNHCIESILVTRQRRKPWSLLLLLLSWFLSVYLTWASVTYCLPQRLPGICLIPCSFGCLTWEEWGSGNTLPKPFSANKYPCCSFHPSVEWVKLSLHKTNAGPDEFVLFSPWDPSTRAHRPVQSSHCNTQNKTLDPGVKADIKIRMACVRRSLAVLSFWCPECTQFISLSHCAGWSWYYHCSCTNMSLDNEPEWHQTEEKCKSFPSGLHEQRFQTQPPFFSCNCWLP